MIDIALKRLGLREFYASTADEFAINHKIQNRIDESLEPPRSRSKSRGPPASSSGDRRWTPVDTRPTLEKLDMSLDDQIDEENKEIDKQPAKILQGLTRDALERTGEPSAGPAVRTQQTILKKK